MGKTKTISGIDYCKLFFSMCVVLLHTNVLKGIRGGDYISSFVLKLAVPYFFIASGYFYGEKQYHNDKPVILFGRGGYLSRLLLKLIVFEPISIVIKIAPMVYNGDSISGIIIIVIKSILFYPWGALWYIQALCIAFILLRPIIITKKEYLILVLGIPLYFFCLLCNSFFFLVKETSFASFILSYMNAFISARNGFFVGFLFVGIGVLVSKYKDQVSKLDDNQVILFSVLSYLLFIVEVILIHNKPSLDDNGYYISFVLFVPLLFICSTRIKSDNTKISLLARYFSTSLYLLHSPILNTIDLGMQLLFHLVINRITLFFLTISIAIIVCIPVYRHKKQPIFNLIT